MPEDRTSRDLAVAAAELAAQCVIALSREGALTAERSAAIEKVLRRLAELSRSQGGQIAETEFDWLAEALRRRREA